VTNILKCTTCNQILTSEEVKNHNYCNIEIKNWKTICASSFTTLENDDGEKCALVDGLDGISYRIIEKRPNFVTFDPYDQPKSNINNNYRHGNSTLKQVLLRLRLFSSC